MPKTIASKIVKAVMTDLDDRNVGFDSIDNDIREEIRESWEEMAEKIINKTAN